MQEQNPIVLMNFSGIYREEEFWKNRQVSWIELQDVITRYAPVARFSSEISSTLSVKIW